MISSLMISIDSENRKLGTMNATYRPVGPTCPHSCAMLKPGGGCYARVGPTGMQAINSKARTDDFTRLLLSKHTYTRHHVSGDVFDVDGKIDTFYVMELLRFYRQHPEHTGFTYTHDIEQWDTAGFTVDTIPANFQVIASCDTDEQLTYAIAHGWKYARVTETQAIGKGEVFCPIDKLKHNGARIDEIDNVNCANCKLCFNSKFVKLNIVFMKQKPGRKAKPE